MKPKIRIIKGRYHLSYKNKLFISPKLADVWACYIETRGFEPAVYVNY